MNDEMEVHKPSGLKRVWIIVEILLVAVFVLSYFAFQYFSKHGSISPVACTSEAKLCPNGTAVGRTGPNCEFAPCPTN